MDGKPEQKRYVKLNPEQSIKLIDQVKRYPELWCKSSKQYRNITKQELAWIRLSPELGISPNDAKSNWRALLANFRVYRTRVRKSQVTGSGHGEIYRPRWFAYESMLFVTESSDVVETTDTIGLARPTSHSHSATAMQSTVTSQVSCSSQNSSLVSGSPNYFSVEIIPDISNNISNSPSTDLFDSSNDELSNDPHSLLNTYSNLLPPASPHRAPTPRVASTSTTRQRRQRAHDHNENELTASLQKLVDITNQHTQRASSRIAIDVANWIENFDSRQQTLVIGKLYQAMHSIETDVNERNEPTYQ